MNGTLYIYAARPKTPSLSRFQYVGAATSASDGPFSAFSRILYKMRTGRFGTGQRLAGLLPDPSQWEVRILEVDERFQGTKVDVDQRKLFYMYWVQRHEDPEQVLINRRMPMACNPTWTRTWSVLDNRMML